MMVLRTIDCHVQLTEVDGLTAEPGLLATSSSWFPDSVSEPAGLGAIEDGEGFVIDLPRCQDYVHG